MTQQGLGYYWLLSIVCMGGRWRQLHHLAQQFTYWWRPFFYTALQSDTQLVGRSTIFLNNLHLWIKFCSGSKGTLLCYWELPNTIWFMRWSDRLSPKVEGSLQHSPNISGLRMSQKVDGGFLIRQKQKAPLILQIKLRWWLNPFVQTYLSPSSP